VLRGYSHGSARVRARHSQGHLLTRTQLCSNGAHCGARRGMRAARTHRIIRKLSADSAAGIVPSSKFE
jgi:hypothetical protein